MKSRVQTGPADRWQSRDLNPKLSVPKTLASTTCHRTLCHTEIHKSEPVVSSQQWRCASSRPEVTPTSPPGTVTEDGAGLAKDARVFSVFPPHTEKKCSRLFTGSSSSQTSWLHPWPPWSCGPGDGWVPRLGGQGFKGLAPQAATGPGRWVGKGAVVGSLGGGGAESSPGHPVRAVTC